MLKSRDLKAANYVAYARGSSGYLKACRDCGRTIYVKEDFDGKWRPYSSWVEGDVQLGQWELHQCAPEPNA